MVQIKHVHRTQGRAEQPVPASSTLPNQGSEVEADSSFHVQGDRVSEEVDKKDHASVLCCIKIRNGTYLYKDPECWMRVNYFACRISE